MAAPVAASPLTIREAANPAECGEISALFTSIWGGHQHIPPELGRAIVESGGYVVAARRGDVVVGASVAVVGAFGRPRAPPLAHHRRHPERATPRRRARAQAPSAGVGSRARHGPHRVDVRSSRSSQRATSTSLASERERRATRSTSTARCATRSTATTTAIVSWSSGRPQARKARDRSLRRRAMPSWRRPRTSWR